MADSPLARAIALKGSQTKLAEATGYTQQTISYYQTTGKQLPAEMAIAIERATDGEVPRWQTRPDLFTPPADNGDDNPLAREAS